MLFRVANLSQLAEFDEVIDVRTPAEFAEDHIPGAINCPVFSNEERITVGTLYKQVSPFEARKLGAALIAKNIAHHLETRFSDHPKSWKPLIYCWRGGQRSGAMSIILAQVGWAAHKLEGGYKTYRREVLSKLETLPPTLKYRVVCGATGTGKSRLLAALSEQGAQVLDLEGLAQHRGSLLGGIPEQPQPSQKWFESALIEKMHTLNSDRPVYVESESSKIGKLTLPASLHTSMHSSPCVKLETATPARIKLLMQDYDHFLETPLKLTRLLQFLRPFHGAKRVDEWAALIDAQAYPQLVEELLTMHYDPSYQRALELHYKNLAQIQRIELNDLEPNTMQSVAASLIAEDAAA